LGTPDHRNVRRTIAVAIVLTVLGAGWATAAPAQAAEPVVSVTTTDGAALHETDCKGASRTTVRAAITMTVARTGDTSTPLDVSLRIRGSLAGPSGLPSQVTIPSGASQITFTAQELGGGFLWIDIIDTADYVATLGSVEAHVDAMIADLGCGIGSPSSEQTIPVGTTPAAVDVEAVAYGPPDSLERSVVGEAPTGTTFHLDGTWSGTATEVGRFFLQEYFCEPDGWCPYRADITVHVVPSDVLSAATPPTSPAAPAAAVPGAPQLTG
jgi:hypothetical protein